MPQVIAQLLKRCWPNWCAIDCCHRSEPVVAFQQLQCVPAFKNKHVYAFYKSKHTVIGRGGVVVVIGCVCTWGEGGDTHCGVCPKAQVYVGWGVDVMGPQYLGADNPSFPLPHQPHRPWFVPLVSEGCVVQRGDLPLPQGAQAGLGTRHRRAAHKLGLQDTR